MFRERYFLINGTYGSPNVDLEVMIIHLTVSSTG